MDLPHSDACLVQAYPAETSEAFCDGHNVSFQFFGGVPHSILYDNLKLAVARILGDGTRQRTRVFSELQSHYWSYPVSIDGVGLAVDPSDW
jgi:transposase